MSLKTTAPIQERILLLTKKIYDSPTGGRELLCKLNFDALKCIYGEGLVLYELGTARLSGVCASLKAVRGYIDGLNAVSIQSILLLIESENINKVFVDGSNLGEAVAALKRIHPQVQVIVFFHNVECRFFWGSLCLHKSFRTLAVFLANTMAERKAVLHSDKRICLSQRDSRLMRKLYGKGATHIAPMALEDKMTARFVGDAQTTPELFALFVGGTFYANREGIAWFVKHVVPRINLPIYIVGRGFEALRAELEIPAKVSVIGSVDSLEEWYRRARFVIAPIFDGSGMKTKVAEALMYGKKIIGTPEAFSGYEDISRKVGWLCRTPDEFVSAINEACGEVISSFDPDLREIYLKNYSLTAAQERLKSIMK
jgi:glycosyltransferase involved in cell wall biosynthesis